MPIARGPSTYHANVQVSRRFRWVLRGTSADGMNTRFSVGITANALCQALGIVRDDSTNPIQYAGLFAAVRLRNVKLYYMPPRISAFEQADTLPAEGAWSISIEPFNTFTNYALALDEQVASSTGADDGIMVSFTPDPLRYPNLTAWRQAADESNLVIVKGYPGTIVDVTADFMIPDAVGNDGYNTTTTNGAAVNGAVGYGYLDVGVAPGSRSWMPVGATLSFS
jgi:hypothetical protein